MAKFQELWDTSQLFRRLFLATKVFPSSRHYDTARAELYWYDRFPRIEWGVCPEKGCETLVEEGARCGKHHRGSGMPRWAWSQGDLYRYMRSHIGKDGKVVCGKGDEWTYRKYRIHQAEKVFGSIPDRFTVHCVDGNPFNIRTDNLAVLSRVAKAAIDAGHLTFGQAVEMDAELDAFFSRLGSRGRPKAIWSYNYKDIADWAGVRVERVRQEVSRGKLDPKDFSSIADFCNRVGRSDSVIMSVG